MENGCDSAWVKDNDGTWRLAGGEVVSLIEKDNICSGIEIPKDTRDEYFGRIK